MIKFGSRVDVIFPADAALRVKPGQRVKGGASILAVLPVPQLSGVSGPGAGASVSPDVSGGGR
jgi:hypothetical protein